MQKKINYAQYLTLILVSFMLVGSFTWMDKDISVTTEKVYTDINLSELELQISELKSDVFGVQSTLDEDLIWKTEAIELATAEWTKRDYKEIYEFLDYEDNKTIDEREDIDKVLIKDSEVKNFDVDEKNANVEQLLKVYYEDLEGYTVKVYLTVITTIEDGEVEDVEYIFE